MTQDYEPIELTDDTPEPKDEGTYLLYFPCVAPNLLSIYHSSDGWEFFGVTDKPITWPELIKSRNVEEKVTIQSLADHDAQIRAEALTLTDEELAIMETAYSESIEEYEGDGLGAMSIAVKAVTKHREENQQ